MNNCDNIIFSIYINRKINRTMRIITNETNTTRTTKSNKSYREARYKTNKVYITRREQREFPLSAIVVDERYVDMYTN